MNDLAWIQLDGVCDVLCICTCDQLLDQAGLNWSQARHFASMCPLFFQNVSSKCSSSILETS